MKFPVLRDYIANEYPDCPRYVEWELLTPHIRQVYINHSQSLVELADRGGLSPGEIYAIMHDHYLSHVPVREAVDYILSISGGKR